MCTQVPKGPSEKYGKMQCKAPLVNVPGKLDPAAILDELPAKVQVLYIRIF